MRRGMLKSRLRLFLLFAPLALSAQDAVEPKSSARKIRPFADKAREYHEIYPGIAGRLGNLNVFFKNVGLTVV